MQAASRLTSCAPASATDRTAEPVGCPVQQRSRAASKQTICATSSHRHRRRVALRWRVAAAAPAKLAAGAAPSRARRAASWSGWLQSGRTTQELHHSRAFQMIPPQVQWQRRRACVGEDAKALALPLPAGWQAASATPWALAACRKRAANELNCSGRAAASSGAARTRPAASPQPGFSSPWLHCRRPRAAPGKPTPRAPPASAGAPPPCSVHKRESRQPRRHVSTAAAHAIQQQRSA